MTSPPYLTDSELSDICRPYRQHAARARYLQKLGLRVERRPDGSPLVWRSDWERAKGQQRSGPNWSKA